MTDPIEFEKEKSEEEEEKLEETKVQFEPASEDETSRCATRTIVREPELDETPPQDEAAEADPVVAAAAVPPPTEPDHVTTNKT